MADSEHHRRFEELLRDLFAEFGEFDCHREVRRRKWTADYVLKTPSGEKYWIELRVRDRITPQIAFQLFSKFREEKLAEDVLHIVYAPVISPRVAEIAEEYGLSWMDSAGNCRIVNRTAGLLISRKGRRTDASLRPVRDETLVDPFSTKSSRIVRVMLHEPKHGWQIRELAAHPEVDVSVGLASKVKQALVHEGYAVTANKLLQLNRPLDLLSAWSKVFSGSEEEHPFYVRGDTEKVEQKVADWCDRNGISYGLARLSAAWRLAPEVRYTLSSIYVDSELFRPQVFERFRSECDAKVVESGANLSLMIPYDRSVFTRRVNETIQVCSPLQTYLDLQQLSGRGEEAAQAVFEKYLREPLESASAAMKELP